MTKLAIVEEREEDKYEQVLALRHYRNGDTTPTALDPPDSITVPVEAIIYGDQHVRALVDGVMQSLSSARQEAVQAWEEELEPCEHALLLAQLTTGHIPASGASTPPLLPYLQLELKSARWWMLGGRKGWRIARNAISRRTSGFVSPAARSDVGASFTAASVGTVTRLRILQRVSTRSVSNLGLSRLRATLVSRVLHFYIHNKLTLGGPDIYCYACNDSRIDPELVLHLANFGINVQTQKKTEKSMTELVRLCLFKN